MDTTAIIQYVILFNITVLFTVMGFYMKDLIWKIILKVTAGICWVAFALIQFIVDPTTVLTSVFAMITATFGIVIFFSIIQDVMTNKTGYQPKRKMGVFD